MRKIFYFFSKCNDQDIDWFIGVGKKEDIKKGHVLIQEGEKIDTLYITIDGGFKVSKKGTDIASIGAGEVLGEMSFLDSRPPSASVVTTDDCVVLSIPIARLQSKLRVDTGFASRFYFALGVLLADRMRETVSHLAISSVRNLEESVEEFNEISSELLDDTSLAAARFDKMRKNLLPS